VVLAGQRLSRLVKRGQRLFRLVKRGQRPIETSHDHVKGQKPGPVGLTGGSLNTTTVGSNGGGEPIDSELIMGVGMTRKQGAVVQLNQQCSIQGGVEAVLLYIVVK
jgi:hypothetical protein